MTLRLPLQSGASVLPLLVLGAVTGAGAAMGGVAAAAMLSASRIESNVFALLPIVAVLVFGGAALYAIASAIRRRASDLVIDGPVVRVEGGPHDGLRFTADDIEAPHGCRTFELEDEYRQSGEGPRVHTRVLRLSLRHRSDVDLAQSTEIDERVSLSSIAETITAMVPGAKATVAEGPPEVSRCPGCGAPLPATDASRAPCPYCGVDADIPEELRARVRDALTLAAHRRETSRAIEVMLSQPSARRMNTALLITIALFVAAAPIGYAAGPVVAAGTVVLALSITLAMLHERRAFRVVSCDLAAASDGHERRCRVCRAPLASPAEVVVRCMYCAADNVVAYDLRKTLEPLESAPLNVDEVLARTRRDAMQLRIVAVASLLWTLGGATWHFLGR